MPKLPVSLAALGVLIMAAALLCMSVTVLPLADFPNHLARLFILTHLSSDDRLAEYYRSFWSFQPNLALEGLAYVLSPLFDIYTVGRLLGAMTFASLAVGIFALHYVLHERFSSAALLPFVLIFNRFFIWGSLGYLVSLGCAFGAMAVWLAYRRRPLIQLMLGTVLATAVYLGHLYAFAVYAACTAGYEARGLLLSVSPLRRVLLRGTAVGAQLLPAAVLLLFFSPTTQGPDVAQWPTLIDKALGPIVLFPGYDLRLEVILLAACLGAMLFAYLRGWARLRFDFVFAMAALVVLYLVLPDRLFTGYSADRRLLVPLAILFLVSFDWSAMSRRAQAAQWLLVGVTSVTSLANAGVHWETYDRTYGELRRLTAMVTPGARVFGVMVNAGGQYLPYPPLQEVVSLAVIERSAFVPSLFVYPTNAASSPLVYTAAYAPLAKRTNVIFGSHLNSVQEKFDVICASAERDRFDYLLLIDSRKFSLDVPRAYQLLGMTSDGRGRLFHITR